MKLLHNNPLKGRAKQGGQKGRENGGLGSRGIG